MVEKSNNSKLFSGILWSSIEVIINRLQDLVVKLVLARLLFPEDFGIIGMATVFTSLIQVLNEAGMGSALIQKKQEDLRDEHYQTIFWTGVVWSLILYLFVSFVLGPFAASFYKEPLLVKIIPVLSLSIISSSVNTIHKSQLMRDLRFKDLAFINNVSSIFSGILSVVLAFLGFGVWALVFNSVASFLITMPMFFRATKWMPKFVWRKEAFKEMFGFGAFTTGTQIANNISSNIDYLILGKIVSASVLGAYALAFMLTSLVKAQVASMLNRVMFPFYSTIQSDIEEVKKYYLSVIKYYSILMYPIMLVLIILGKPIVFAFFGNKWGDTIIPMQILAIAVLIDVMTSGYSLLFRGIGKPKVEMMIQVYTALFLYIPSVIVGAFLNGAIGVAYGILFSNILSFIVAIILLYRNFNIKFKHLFSALKPAIVTFLVTFLIIYPIFIYSDINPFIILGMLVIVNLSITSIFLKDEIRMILKKIKR